MFKQKILNADMKILLLEDMEDIREQMKKDLKEIGHEASVDEAETVQKALEFCKLNRYDFIISDWNLPDGNGFDFLQKVKASSKFKTTPFLMCTTMDDVSNILSAVEAGANDYLVKPWDNEELSKKIQSCLD
jgi:two-component system chemotaxis response regulator CheY